MRKSLFSRVKKTLDPISVKKDSLIDVVYLYVRINRFVEVNADFLEGLEREYLLKKKAYFQRHIDASTMKRKSETYVIAQGIIANPDSPMWNIRRSKGLCRFLEDWSCRVLAEKYPVGYEFLSMLASISEFEDEGSEALESYQADIKKYLNSNHFLCFDRDKFESYVEVIDSALDVVRQYEYSTREMRESMGSDSY